MNDTTRRYPRTLEQAFGPGHRTLDEPIERLGFIGLGILAVSIVLGVTLVAGIVTGLILRAAS